MADEKNPEKSEVGSTKSKSSNKSKESDKSKGSDKSKDSKKSKESKKSEKKDDEQKSRLKKISVDIPDEVMQSIDEECKNMKENESASKIAEKLHTMLEKKYKKGWCVFVGRDYFGLVMHEVNTCLVFEIDDQRVSIFKCYVPEGA